jgi:hypothetical protein
MGWSLFGLLMYGLYRLNNWWVRDYNLLVKDNRELVAKYNDAALKYNTLLSRSQGQGIQVKEVTVKKSLLN